MLAALRHNRTHSRRVVDEAVGASRHAAGEKSFMTAAMVGKLMSHRTHDRVSISTLRMQRQQFADVDPFNVRRYRFEESSILLRRIRLHVVHFHMWRPAWQPDENDRGVVFHGLAGRCFRRCRFESQDVTQAQHPEAQRTRFQNASPRNRTGAHGNRPAGWIDHG